MDQEALTCDLAETYHIYDYKQLPPLSVAVFACGLRENSRIKMAMNGQKISLETTFLAGITDRLSMLVWANSKDGQKGKNKPKSVLDSFFDESTSDKSEAVFNSSEDFEKTRQAILNNIEQGGEE